MANHDPQPPHLPSVRQLNTYQSVTLVEDQTIEQTYFTINASGLEVKRLTLVECVLNRSNCAESKIFQPHLRDCRLEHVDLSNADWPEGNMARIQITDSKLTGWKINESILSDILVKDCKADYAQFQLLKTKRIMFDHCDLTSAYFNESDLRQAVFKDCDLTRVDFTKTRLHGADLRGCTIDGIRLDLHFLQGLKVDLTQAIYLAQMLGLVIE